MEDFDYVLARQHAEDNPQPLQCKYCCELMVEWRQTKLGWRLID